MELFTDILFRRYGTPSLLGRLPLCRHYLKCNHLLNWHNWPPSNCMIKPKQSKGLVWLKLNFCLEAEIDTVNRALLSITWLSKWPLLGGNWLPISCLLTHAGVEIFGELWEPLCKALGGSRLICLAYTPVYTHLASAQYSHSISSAQYSLSNIPDNMELTILSDSMIRTYREAFTRSLNFNIKWSELQEVILGKKKQLESFVRRCWVNIKTFTTL